MALRIFDTDPEAAAKAKSSNTFDDGTVGRLHSGKLVDGEAVSLDHWEVSTGDADTANLLGELFRAEVVDTFGKEENHLRVEDTRTDRLEVIISGPGALTSDLKLWVNGNLFHHCDGVSYLSPSENAGQPCGCPQLFEERKNLAKVGRGPKPDIKLVVQLADAPDLGTFAFKSGSWKMAEDLWKYEDKLAEIGGPAVADLVLFEVDYTTKKGRHVNYRMPILERIRPYDDANAE